MIRPRPFGARIAAADLHLARGLQASTSPAISRLMAAASWPGFPPQSRIIPSIVVGGLWIHGRRTDAAFQAAAWASSAVASLIKAVVRRPRPGPGDVRIAPAPLDRHSFPSGHVLGYVGSYGFLAYLAAIELRRPSRRIVKVGSAAVLGTAVGLVALVGPSRVERGHHWPTDVAASYVIGAVYLAGLIRLHQTMTRRSLGGPVRSGVGGDERIRTAE